MHTSPQKQQFNSSKRDFFESSSLSKGFFHDNEEEYEPQTYQEGRKEMNMTGVSGNFQGFDSQRVESQVNTSRRNKSSKLKTPNKQPLKQDSTPSLPQQRSTYKKRSTRQKKNDVELLDDQQLIIHDQIMFSKSVNFIQQQTVSQQKSHEKNVKEEVLFQFDNNDEDEQDVDGKQQQNETNQKEYLNNKRKNNLQQNSDPTKKDKSKKGKFQIDFQPSQLGEDTPQQVSQQKEQQKQKSLENEQISPQQQKPKDPTNQPHLPQTFNQLINKQQQSIKTESGSISSQHFLKILTYPVANKMLMKTNIKRVSGFFNIYPQYHVYFEADKTHLMSAKRVSKTPYSTFVISTNSENFQQNSPYYLGKAKGSVIGDQLDIFGPGFSPSAAFDKKVKPRQFLASIVYETRILNSGQPRDFSVYVKKPQIDYYEHFPQIKMYGDEIPLNLLYQNPHNRDKIILLKNKKPEFISEIRSYSLNFNGRAGVASVKNFILQKIVNSSNKQQASQNDNLNIWPMLFGKVNENHYNMDIGLPLSPLIAFGVALSSFDEKFFCE